MHNGTFKIAGTTFRKVKGKDVYLVDEGNLGKAKIYFENSHWCIQGKLYNQGPLVGVFRTKYLAATYIDYQIKNAQDDYLEHIGL